MVQNMIKRFLTIVLLICVQIMLIPTYGSTIHATETTFTQVASGYGFSMALRSDGTLWGWSDDIYAFLCAEDGLFHPEPIKMMDGVKSVFVADMYSMVIKNDNSLWIWGGFGPFGLNDQGMERLKPLKILNDVKTVYLGEDQAMAIKTDNSLWAWGDGGLGDGTFEDRVYPIKIMDNVKKVSLLGYNKMVVKNDGSLWIWGSNEYGELGDGTKTDHWQPVKIMDGVIDAVHGSEDTDCEYYMALKDDGSLWAWGGSYGMIGPIDTSDRCIPTKIMDGVASIAGVTDSGDPRPIVLKNDGSLWDLGHSELFYFDFGIHSVDKFLRDGYIEPERKPKKILDDIQFCTREYAMTKGRDLWYIGHHFGGDQIEKILEDVKSFDDGIALKNDGSVWSWSTSRNYNFGGARGYGYSLEKLMEGVSSVSVGGNHYMIVKEDGSLWLSGHNENGQLGNGTTLSSVVPVKIMDDVASAFAYANYSMAIKKDGSLWTWGANDEGQLGDGTTVNHSVPVKVLDQVISVSADNDMSVAMKADGSLWGWGERALEPIRIVKKAKFVSGGYYIDESNRLLLCGISKDGSPYTYDLYQIQLSDDIVSVSGDSWEGTMAVKSDGSLWVWGYNDGGRLGPGERNISAPVNLMNDVENAFFGYEHSLIIKRDGTLWGLGDNADGQLGAGTLQSSYTPIKMADDVRSVSTQYDSTMVVKNDGSLWACGNYNHGLSAEVPLPAVQSEEAKMSGVTASLTSSNVFVDGLPIRFEAYNIGGSNYFKLRDLAKVLSGSEKQFDVGWDSIANTIQLTSNTQYTPVGGELAQSGGAQNKVATATTSKLYKDGKAISLTAYHIGGNNYYKLRDVGKTFNFNVEWDEQYKTIAISTEEEYSVGE